MTKIGEILRNYDIRARKYIKIGKAILVESDNDKYILKQNNRDKKIYEYLKSRNFNYFPKILNSKDDEYEITEYQEQIDMPEEQKVLDMIELVSLLHLKTTYYKEVDNDEYKKIYEDLLNNVEYLYSYYIDIINLIESRVYMSPSEYLLARNITKVFNALSTINNEIKDWYKLVENKKKERLAVLHNNLRIDHFIKNDNSYLISWDKSKIDMPIFDLYKFYLNNEDYDFVEILKLYEKNYPLLEDEKRLLFILIKMPPLLEIEGNEYIKTIKIRKMLNNLDRVNEIELPKASEDTP